MIRGLEHLISDFEHAEELEKIVVARATGNIYNHVFYEPLRMYFLENEELKLLAARNNAFYINPNEFAADENGYLRSDLSEDGCHLN